MAKTAHKLQILRPPITYLRKSAAHDSCEVSYFENRGGLPAASELKTFYQNKYVSFLPLPTPSSIEQMLATHMSVQPAPFRTEFGAECDASRRPVQGLDGLCYEAIRTYHRKDTEGRPMQELNKVLRRDFQMPPDLKEAKVVLLPKVQAFLSFARGLFTFRRCLEISSSS